MGSDELSWDERILSIARPSIDPTLVAESLRLTPAECLDRLQRMLEFVEVARRRSHHVVSKPARDARQR
jgi:hypothetical protein